MSESLTETVRYLRQRFGMDVKEWQWGNLHTVTWKHTLGRRPLDLIFNLGPFPDGGDNDTPKLSILLAGKGPVSLLIIFKVPLMELGGIQPTNTLPIWQI